MGNSGYRNRYRNLRPGDHGTCVLDYGTLYKHVYRFADYSNYAEVGTVIHRETTVLVLSALDAEFVQVVLPDSNVGWLWLGNRPLYVDSPGKLGSRSLYVVNPRLSVHPNRTVSW